ncbi:UDP-glucose 4-epimerase-like [Saccoglossus kowalevskii]|uniref:UDP-glucose 4-epimerase n=1 Tax=Saccoglossus kowalevskii TaxID=10224 RepID=A0ABM0GUG1_SACKO|nr:PREDICTED: UDP-glucose 4-epimerase-like [Saccoglossus kowalevskii]
MSDNKCILVTGGAGYIGSHTVVELVNAGYDPVVIDNCANAVRASENGRPGSIKRIEKIVDKKIIYYDIDLLNKAALDDLFAKHSFIAVIHFAGLKAVGESIEIPIEYYKVNICGTLNLIECMKKYQVSNLVFSSSATVYGTPQYLPIDENHTVGSCTNPYGKSKYFIEEILRDVGKAEKDWNIILLRYFNPVGSHKSGLIGEDPQGTPNNLMPYVAQVAIGRRSQLSIFGGDYDTPDGTGVRDYIHVVDLALGHIAALKKVSTKCGLKVYNLGTGKGYSVLDMVRGMEKASGKKIPYKIVDRRDGDVGSCYAEVTLAQTELGWKSDRNLEEMCEDLWRWQTKNPKGFQTDNSS